jgi:hypothetical protein
MSVTPLPAKIVLAGMCGKLSHVCHCAERVGFVLPFHPYQCASTVCAVLPVLEACMLFPPFVMKLNKMKILLQGLINMLILKWTLSGCLCSS